MKVSVITIARNDLEGLKRTIKSVAEQSYGEIEHVIIDGNSTDGTGNFLAGSVSNIKWVSEQDEGRYDAMNKGANLATGDIIWFLHSSDIFHSPNSVSFVAERSSDAEFRWGFGLSCIVDGANIIGVGGKLPFNQSRYLIGGNVIPHQATVFSRSFFWDLGGYDVKFGLSADQFFMMRASMRDLPRVWAEVLCDFDALGAGSTRGAWDHYRDMARARKLAGIVVTRSGNLDYLLSCFYVVHTLLDRVMKRMVNRSRPHEVGSVHQ